jgi:hypothetical protein
MSYLLERLKERSTWIGMVAIATGCGVGVTPELANGIVTAGSLIAGTIAAATKD